MQIIEIEVAARRAKVIGSPVLVCNNTGDQIAFTFDEEWADVEAKTARFVYNKDGKVYHQDVPFTGNTVQIPPLSNTRDVRVGVYAGTLTTTTAARIPCEPSVLCGSGEEDDNLFELGRQAERDEFWDRFQNNGARVQYRYAFTDWNQEHFYPKYDIIATDVGAEGMFRGFMYHRNKEPRIDLVERLEACGISLDLSAATTVNYIFYTTSLARLPVVDLTGVTANLIGPFGYFLGTTIDKIILKEDGSQAWTNPFGGTRYLQNITFEGAIGRSIDFSASPLTPTSMKSVITHLKNYAGTSSASAYTVTFNADCWAALEADGSTSPNGNSWADYVNDLGWNV